jgi:hypothetical protein
MGTYKKLLDVLRQNLDDKITPTLLKEMGMKEIVDVDGSWWSDNFASCYFSLRVTYNESVLDVVESIIELDLDSLNDDIAERAAGEDW